MIFDVLDPQTDIFNRYFLEASAGTGKTFAIENIVPRILLESPDPISIDAILVVTFTRAATRELKNRIYKNLCSIADFLQKKQGGPAYLQKFYQMSEERLQEVRSRIEEATICFESVQIFTLHGFCLQALQEFSFEAHFFAGIEEPNGLRSSKIEESLRDFLRCRLEDQRILCSSQLRALCRQEGRDIDKIVRRLMQVLEGTHKIYPYPTAKEESELWVEAIRNLPRISKKELWQDLTVLASRLAQSPKRREQIEDLFHFVETGECTFEQWNAFLSKKEFFLANIKAPSEKQISKLLHPTIFEEMKRVLLPLHSQAINPKIALLKLARAAKDTYQKARDSLCGVSPDYFLELLRKAMENPSFCQKVRAKYKALIIDEFQDTDPLQWEIFYKLFLEEQQVPIVFLVGDPKQSIYGFRNADVYTYIEARKLFSERYCCRLATNYRSHVEFVRACNALFSLYLPCDWMFLPFSKEYLDVAQVLPKPISDSPFSPQEGRIHFLLQENDQEEQLLRHIAGEIRQLHEEKKIPLQQMAVLVKDRYQASRLQKVFFVYKIPCHVQKDIETCYQIMGELIEALIHPHDVSYIKKVLGGPIVGCQAKELEGQWENPLLQKAKQFFICSALFVKQKGFGAFFYDFLSQYLKDGARTIAQNLLESTQSSLYFSLRHLMQVFLQYASYEQLHNPSLLRDFLQELSLRNEDLSIPAEEEEEQVQVMTLHKSKGLEFQVVFALALAIRHEGKQSYVSVRSLEGRQMVAALEEEEEYLLHAQELDAEKLRLLYVAITRAKERVYIPYMQSEDRAVPIGTACSIELFFASFGMEKFSLSAAYENLASLTVQSCISWIEKLATHAAITYEKIGKSFSKEMHLPQEGKDLLAPLPPSTGLQKHFLVSFSSLIQEKVQHEEVLSIEGTYAIPLGAQTGTIIHAILEQACKADLHALPQVIRNCCKKSLLEGLEDLVQELLFRALHTKIPTSIGEISLAEVPICDKKVEVEFLYPLQGSLLKGFIDLVFRVNGKYFILDWKTNALGPTEEEYTQEKIEQCMQQHGYYLQAAIYAKALERWLAICDERPFKDCFVGAIYYFLRGNKPFFFYPDESLLEQYPIEQELWE